MRSICLLLLLTIPGTAQIFGGGIKIGTTLNDAVDIVGDPNSFRYDTRQYIIGPQFELRLPAGFAIELDALYTNVRYTRESLATTALGLNTLDSSNWEFPLLLKKKFGRGAARPFVGAGAAFRRLGDIRRVGRFVVGDEDDPIVEADRNSTGFVIGGGLELRLLFLRLTPELRFVRWGTSNLRQGVSNVLELNRSQGQVLIGVSF